MAPKTKKATTSPTPPKQSKAAPKDKITKTKASKSVSKNPSTKETSKTAARATPTRPSTKTAPAPKATKTSKKKTSEKGVLYRKASPKSKGSPQTPSSTPPKSSKKAKIAQPIFDSDEEEDFEAPPAPRYPTTAQRAKWTTLSMRSQQFFLTMMNNAIARTMETENDDDDVDAKEILEDFRNRFQQSITELKVPPRRRNVDYTSLSANRDHGAQPSHAQHLHDLIAREESSLRDDVKALQIYHDLATQRSNRHEQLLSQRMHPLLDLPSSNDTLPALEPFDQPREPDFEHILSRESRRRLVDMYRQNSQLTTALDQLSQVTANLGCEPIDDDNDDWIQD